jgi:hypothetical protein
MIIQKGQHVKCFMRSTMVLEGIVEEWADVEVVLKSLDGKSIMIVHRPVDGIALTKIVLEEPEILEEDAKKIPKEWSEIKHEMKSKLDQVMQPTGEPDIDRLNLEQLRTLVQEQDRKIIAQKKKEHFGNPGAAKRAVPYSTPKSAYMPGKLPRM